MGERQIPGGLCSVLKLAVALAIIVGACTSSEETAVTNTRVTESTVTSSPNTTAASPSTSSAAVPYEVPEHDIAVRIIDGQGEFYLRDTNERFEPIGPNFHVFRSGPTFVVDQLFAPVFYDSAFIGEQFREMRSLGYNVVRTSLDLCSEDCIGSASGGLRAEWLDNVADFIRLAKDNGLYVILTSNDLPLLAGYVPTVESTCCDPFDGYINSHYLSPVGVEQWSTYWTEVVQALVERETPLDAIMAYQIRGELWLWRDRPPLSLEEGLVTTGNLNTYDMADAAQKEAMIADNVAHWIDEVGGAIRDLDPTALITVGLFVPNSPTQWRPPDDPRLVPDVRTVAASTIDFIDLHPYPGYIPFSRLMENFNLPEVAEKPLIIGETGGFTFVFGSPGEAAQGLQQWQALSCDYGIQGWMFWHWLGTDDHEVWTGSEGDGAIRDVFAPTNRPDPCSQADFDFFEDNLALGKPVSASGSIDGGAPELAIDGWNSSAWQSGAEPRQWFEIDLESEHTVRAVRLVPSQYPEGPTVHVVEMAGADGALSVVHRFEETTSDGQALVHEFSDPPTGIRYVRVTTTSSPSFVSWYEVAVLGE
ncbi:MAG: hypothetical protein GY926_12635 [bacterium]|nr:hypothetical protein [bacterium]MCP4966067.1 hypothetical protein [bacterium]